MRPMTSSTTYAAWLFSALFLLTACEGSKRATASPSSKPVSVPAEAGSFLSVPEGFHVSLYTDAVPGARSLSHGPKGTLFVSTRKNGKVYAVVDRDGDHRVDDVKVVVEGLDTPNGIAYRDGSLFIAEIGRLLRIDGLGGDGSGASKPVVVRDDFPKETHHGWRYLRFGPDGKLYMGIGAPCNVCEKDDPKFASIVRMNGDGTGALEVYAHGVRNTVGFDFHPQDKALWFTDNGRDLLGDDVPPDELNRAPGAGLHFGFPYCHGGDIPDPQYGGRPCSEFKPPVYRFHAHVAALGMRFYEGKMFPSAYRGGIFVAQHGSWNRSEKIGYRVMALTLSGNRVVKAEPFLEGFLSDDKKAVRGRPVDVTELDDGSLVVSDDDGGRLYRVTYRSSNANK